MIDFSLVEGFDWDVGNADKNNKHGVSTTEAEQIFVDGRLLIVTDVNHSGIEPRYQAMGLTEDSRLLHVSFTLRNKGKFIRIISARDASRKERKTYEDQT
jgi:uncharacterized protein